MKTIFTIILTILTSVTSYSQDMNGLYLSQTNDTLMIFNDSLVRFNFNYGCCLLSNYYGFGKLIKFDDYNIIITEDSDWFPNTYIENELLLKDKNIIELIVRDKNKTPLIGVNIVEINEKNRFVKGTITNEDYISFDYIDNSNNLIISLIGYNKFEIPIEKVKGKRIDCILQEGEELFDLDLKLNRLNNDTIILEGIIKKNYKEQKFKKIALNIIWTFTHWPWKWKYKNYHDPKPIKFVKQ